jgi:hypothetical protein
LGHALNQRAGSGYWAKPGRLGSDSRKVSEVNSKSFFGVLSFDAHSQSRRNNCFSFDTMHLNGDSGKGAKIYLAREAIVDFALPPIGTERRRCPRHFGRIPPDVPVLSSNLRNFSGGHGGLISTCFPCRRNILSACAFEYFLRPLGLGGIV